MGKVFLYWYQTDKIVVENRLSYSKYELVKQLKKEFDVEKIVLIPWDRKEEYGHANGILRFINETTVLINELYKYDKKLLYCLENNGLNWEFLSFNVKKDKRIWAYINFLQTKDLILLPKFDEIGENEQALEQIKKYYPDYAKNNRIAQIEMSKIVQLGGALNCITWTIKD